MAVACHRVAWAEWTCNLPTLLTGSFGRQGNLSKEVSNLS
jgi:hypothetical protein